jgi:hypothetical protein
VVLTVQSDVIVPQKQQGPENVSVLARLFVRSRAVTVVTCPVWLTVMTWSLLWSHCLRLRSEQVQRIIATTSFTVNAAGMNRVAYSSSPQFEGLITADLQVESKCLNVVAQRVCGSRTVNGKVAGYTKAAALENAAANTKSSLEAFVKSLQLE